ncbi:unnamed protein product [Lasius platythorax]|uniref:Uncharacterized protein n=1 Tax=Lasius platythorax TaxID=488582 RepID=A0AAV2NVA5_9HYME
MVWKFHLDSDRANNGKPTFLFDDEVQYAGTFLQNALLKHVRYRAFNPRTASNGRADFESRTVVRNENRFALTRRQ